ncbi:M14 family metallopeptidase [Aridibaculum aurantiacum]|uniref:M14 family metallopeptidase n=1 Tax=Aridibaculum aurantiacum TaxID=2810307 RepID=UPI001A96CBBD|nr:M14 family metallopeptidase [Aridibaculum aurantiacum]
MKILVAITYILFSTIALQAQSLITTFEKSSGKETATYFEAIKHYELLDKKYSTISIKKFGLTDAGYPLHLVVFSAAKTFDPAQWEKNKNVVLLINNGIHPGEPDGIDASMMLLRDLASGKIAAPSNVVIGFIPVYNIGGALNRNSFSRVNQNGPVSYGFRGNAQNLDLNRDFTKNDSRNAKAFATIFHYMQPHILMDNHVSDGADYQHTMTLLTSQHNKLGGEAGKYLHDHFEPALYKGMDAKGWPMCPYVNFESANPEKGWLAFYDPPRYSSGYAALFGTIGFVPETHMLKPYKDRVLSTYALMQTLIEESSKQAANLVENKRKTLQDQLSKNDFPLSWTVDSTKNDIITFLGYEAGRKTSEVTGMQRLYYDRSKPFSKEVKYYNFFKPKVIATAPKVYIIPQGWHSVIDILKLNNVKMQQLAKDTVMEVQAARIESYKSMPRPYEKHHKNYDTEISWSTQKIRFLKGDYIISTNQPAKRYLVEMLTPNGDDSFFAWNFFDAILQQKEGYSDYRWEDVAATYLAEHPELKEKLEQQKKADETFAGSASAQLNFIYKHSPYYEPAHLRYPVYNLR